MSTIAFYTGTSGLIAFQNALDVTAHNIANVNTNGFKARRAAFDDLLRSQMNTNVEGDHLVGHGVKQESIDQLMTQSGLRQTGQGLDFALDGDGFFSVDNNGKREYTRNGAFQISVEGGAGYLVTNDGAYVLDRGGNRIALQKQGEGDFRTDDITGRLGIYRFQNQYGLIAENNARFSVSPNSGPADQVPLNGTAQSPLEVLQGVLEVSNVDLAQQMVNMITDQRSFQMNSRMVQTADQLADIVNNLR